MKFYLGIADISMAWIAEYSMISLTKLWNKSTPFIVNKWILDSGGYTQISMYGRYICSPKWYAWRINKLKSNGTLQAAAVQDWQCGDDHLAKTGKSMEEHQELTIRSLAELRPLTDVYIMPVLQGRTARDYVNHLRWHGSLIRKGDWVAVGGIAGKYQKLGLVYEILDRVKSERGDIKIHALGLTESTIQYMDIVKLIYSTDSVTWRLNFKFKHHRKTGVWDDNVLSDPRHALKFAHKIEKIPGVEKVIYGSNNLVRTNGSPYKFACWRYE